MPTLNTVNPDAWRVSPNGSRAYQFEEGGPFLPSATSIKPPFKGRSRTPLGTLVPLDASRAAEFALDNRARLAELDPDLFIEEVALAPELALRRAGDRGSEVHTWIETYILGGAKPEPSPEAFPYVDAFVSFAIDYRPTWLATEVIAVGKELAGTIDVIFQVGNKTVLADWKTRSNRHGAYPEEIGQLGCYLSCDHLVVGEHPGERTPMPEIDELAIVSLGPDGSYALYPVDLEQARSAAQCMWAAWQATQGLAEHSQAAIAPPVLAAPAGSPDQDELLERRVAWIKARVGALPPAARAEAVRTWPTDVPKKAAVIVSHLEVDAIAACLAAVEAAHSLPFHDGDPGREPTRPKRH